MSLIGAACIFSACEDDRDANPVLLSPETFELNTPAYASSQIDLESSNELRFTFSQPDYGYTAAVTYQVQVSLTDTWTLDVDDVEEDSDAVGDYSTIDESYTSCSISVTASLFAKSIAYIAQWTEDEVPADLTVYVRVKATCGGNVCYSNVVEVLVAPYYIELSDADIILWYILGSNIGDGSWSNKLASTGVSNFPFFIDPDYAYDSKTGTGEIVYTNYFGDGNSFKILPSDFNWSYAMISDGANTAYYRDGGDDADNITCSPAGVYTITINTSANSCTIAAYDGDVTDYSEGIALSGDFNEWSDAECTAVDNNGEKNLVWAYLLEVES